MRIQLFKSLMFLFGFGILQIIILPWIISTEFLPLWTDVILLSVALVLWVSIIDKVTNLGRKFWREDELSSK